MKYGYLAILFMLLLSGTVQAEALDGYASGMAAAVLILLIPIPLFLITAIASIIFPRVWLCYTTVALGLLSLLVGYTMITQFYLHQSATDVAMYIFTVVALMGFSIYRLKMKKEQETTNTP